MGHLTLKMISIVFASVMIFGLAQAENRAEKSEESQEQESSSSESSSTDKAKKEKEARDKKAAEHVRAEQTINRALRDQGKLHGPVIPAPPPAAPKSK